MVNKIRKAFNHRDFRRGMEIILYYSVHDTGGLLVRRGTVLNPRFRFRHDHSGPFELWMKVTGVGSANISCLGNRGYTPNIHSPQSGHYFRNFNYGLIYHYEKLEQAASPVD